MAALNSFYEYLLLFAQSQKERRSYLFNPFMPLTDVLNPFMGAHCTKRVVQTQRQEP